MNVFDEDDQFTNTTSCCPTRMNLSLTDPPLTDEELNRKRNGMVLTILEIIELTSAANNLYKEKLSNIMILIPVSMIFIFMFIIVIIYFTTTNRNILIWFSLIGFILVILSFIFYYFTINFLNTDNLNKVELRRLIEKLVLDAIP